MRAARRRTFLPVGERISIHALLADYVELQDVASRAHIRTLANYTECPFTKTALEALAADNSTAYREEVLLKRKSIIDLLEQFPACKLPLEIYLEMLPPLAPRYYSISSSPLHADGRCSITVGVVRGPARSGRGAFAGVCSNFISRQAEGSVVYAFVKDTKSHFYLPQDPKVPVIMIGPGTGLAPFRGFLQERAAMKAKGMAVGTSLLFFGCRHEKQDFLYADELKEFASQGVTELHVAFSRMQSEKVYVQDHIRGAKDTGLVADRGGRQDLCMRRRQPHGARRPKDLDRRIRGQARGRRLDRSKAFRPARRRQPLPRRRLGSRLDRNRRLQLFATRMPA